MPKSKSTFFTDERKDTDKSLTAEREKTNVSLASARRLIEEQTDLSVKKERLETDQLRTTIRNEADIEREIQRDHSSKSSNITRAQKKGDEQISTERRDSDIAIGEERLKADSALEQERELKKSKTEDVLRQERVSTDRNLSNERSKTDSEVEMTSGRLLEEIASHVQTKASLTTRDEFLAIVSHDLRNPIGSILSCVNLLIEDLPESADADLRHSLRLIQRNATTGLHLIEDILDMESIAMGQFKLKLEKTTVGSIIEEVQENFSVIAREKSITFEVVKKNFSTLLICDRDRIKQIITNLLVNALKFTESRGAVRIEVNLIHNQVEISVHDNGPGISAEKKVQIFERFAQLGNHDRRGLGLGLYISMMLTEAHKGRIWVDSEVGEGSHFYISLPVAARSLPL